MRFKISTIFVFSFFAFFISCAGDKSKQKNDLESFSDNDIDELEDTSDTSETDISDDPDVSESEEDDLSEPDDETDSDVDAEIPDEVECPECLIIEEIKCAPSEDACSEKTVDSAFYASFRKDFYYPDYQEGDVLSPIPAPTTGGRFNTTGIALKGGKVTKVSINGIDVADLLTQTKLDWYHVYPLVFKTGEAFWVNFHSRESSWDSAMTGTVKVETEEGVAFEGSFDVKINQVPLKYVGFADDYKTVVIHLENRSQNPAKLNKLLFNGRDITETACIADKILPVGVTTMITLPLCEAVKPGDPWTVTAIVEGLPVSTAGGRVIKSFFPVLTWQKDDDCPYSPYNTALFENHKSHGFNTFFTRPSHAQMCSEKFGKGTSDIFELVGPVSIADDIYSIFTLEDDSHFLDFSDVSRIAAGLHADECDNSLLDNGYPKPETRAQYARKAWAKWPEMPTYIGGSRGRYNGSFAGATDIQGFDYYIAACAPHITVAGTHPPLRGSFDQLYLVHENQMPHTTWAYSQGLSGGWNTTIPVVGTKVYRQPNPAELRIQALNVAMVGAKGLMYFQTPEDMIEMFPETWAEIGSVNRDINGLKPYLLEGSIYKIIDVPDSHIVSVLRSRKVMTAIIMNLKADNIPTESQCLSSQNAHWILGSNTVSFDLEVPQDFRVFEILELRAGQFSTPNYSIDGRSVTFENVSLGHNDAARVFVLNSDAGIKSDMLSRMSY